MAQTFLGLQPYAERDAYRFKGRSEESADLFRLVARNDFTVCYAESGEGKTSLLNAGVFPLLRQNMYFPIAITFTNDDYQATPDSFDRIINRCIKDSISEYNEQNQGINIEYRLCTTDFAGLDCQERLQAELSNCSWWKLRNYKPQAMGLVFTPVFVFDQFEEVFSMPGSIVWTKTFFDWLEEVSSDSCPDYIINKVRSIIGHETAFPAIKEEKDFKAIFSLRKEFIGELDYWGMQTHFIPALKDNRYCLKPLTYDGARKVMTQQERFDASKVEQVLTYFVGQYSREPERTIEENLPVIPALLLSVVCDSWEKDIEAFAALDANEIGQSLSKILERFYDQAIDSILSDLSKQSTDFQPEQCRYDIETALFKLVDRNGKRVRTKTTANTLTQIDFDGKFKKILSDNRIIKVTKIDGEDYVEIVHDALCPVIAKKKEVRLAAEAKEREEQRLSEQARKMRRRMSIFGLFALIVVGIMAFFLWQNRRLLMTQESLNLSEAQRDSIQKQKDAVSLLNESLNKQIQINEVQRDSLNRSLLKQNELNQKLNNQMLQVNSQKKLIEKQNEELQSFNDVISSQYYALKAKNDSLQSLADMVELINGVNERQSETIVQNNLSMSLEMKNAYDACVAIRSALESNSIQNLYAANEIFKKYNTAPFNSLRSKDDKILSLNGHFIFNTDFIDSLIAGQNVYPHAQNIANRSTYVSRGLLAAGGILLKNGIVGKGSIAKYSFASRGYQELAIVTEPGGMVTLNVYDKTNQKWYNDVKNVRKGMTTRFISFNSGDKRVVIEFEVINTSDRDVSFVILSN